VLEQPPRYRVFSADPIRTTLALTIALRHMLSRR
jgi:hypothetical protein